MRLFGKPVTEIGADDLDRLVASSAAESRTLEFKRDWIATNDDAHKECLADISALANTDGGVIVYGVESARASDGSDTGIVERLAPITLANWESERLRIINLLNDGLSPPLGGVVAIRAIPARSGNGVIVIVGVPRSILGPHMIVAKKRNQFWRRSEAGRYLPGVQELRQVFLEGQTWVGQAEDFRTQRLEALRNGRLRGFPHDLPLALVHVLPLGRLGGLMDLEHHSGALMGSLTPPDAGGHSGRYNADGYLRYTPGDRGDEISSYAQCFRFGGIEGGVANIGRILNDRTPAEWHLFGSHIRRVIQSFLRDMLAFMKSPLALEPPYAAMLSFIRIEGYKLAEEGSGRVGRPIEVDRILLPVIVLEGSEALVHALKPAFDVLWQSSGIPGAPIDPAV